MSRHDSPFQNEEEVPPKLEMADLGERHGNKVVEGIIKEKEAHIRELKDDLSKANFMVAFLQHKNRKLRQNKM